MFTIIHQSKNYIVCQKPVGVSSQKDTNKKDMTELISEALRIPIDSVYPVHRLDNLVGGTMVYAISAEGAAGLGRLVSENRVSKQYLAVVHGCPEEQSGIFEDLLFKDTKRSKSYVVKRMRKGVKTAKLEYTVLQTVKTDTGDMSLVQIKLHTGRTHQIRVQFSSRKMPLVGDRRYGSGKDGCNVALWSHRLDFVSPFEMMAVTYCTMPDINTYPWNLFDKLKEM